MRIAFCGHSYHRTTGSSAILLDVLREQADVEVFWDEAWLTGSELDLTSVESGRFDAVVVWQVEAAALRLARLRHPNVTFFPMYDGCYAKPDSYWRSLACIKIVCFSAALHEKLQRLGLRTRFVRYYPDPDAVERASAGPELAGFLWQRRQEVTWATVRPLLGEAAFRRFTLHAAVDPGGGDFFAPSEEDVRRYAIRTTTWFPTREEAAADLARHNVYFAPRVREGIGLSFLEAMARGLLVVAPDAPTMNEYIVSGVNGILYDPLASRPLDFSRFAELGARARRSVELGRRKWCRSVPALLEFVREPTADHPVAAGLDALDPAALDVCEAPAVGARGHRRRARKAEALEGGHDGARGTGDSLASSVTVAVVTRNAVGSLRHTIASIARQDHSHAEIVVVDRASEDGTVELLRELDGSIAAWRSTPDRGRSEAMNAAADLAWGRYLLVLDAGDVLPTVETLSLALDGAPVDADVIVGHRIYRHREGERLHPAAHEDQWGALLRVGEVGPTWLVRTPSPGAILTRADLVRERRYLTELRYVAELDLLCRLAEEGRRFHHSLEVIAAGPAAGSQRLRAEWLDELRRVVMARTRAPAEAARALAEIRRTAVASELEDLSAPRLLLSLARTPGAAALLLERFKNEWTRHRARLAGR